ncbi:serine/threonine protein kinase [Candidatus Obscuribacterales bacterium]|nr:serine/threonine protein kinase [Candidatus Obscuribacterales bacterium]
MDLSTDDTGIPYMVMEYVDGITLESHLATNGPFPLARTLKLMDEICDALSYSHNLGIMHRDVKSSNILLSKEHAYLIDFGIAKFKGIMTDGDLDLSTTDNTMVGSPLYMPPDQGLGFAYDERSEVYSVGCVLFEALTGRTPFSGGSSLQILSQHAHTQAPSLSETAPQLEFPQELEMVVAKCLEKQPDDRFQSISELRTALNQIHLVDEVLSEVESSIDFGDVNLVQAATGIMPTDVQSNEAGFKRSSVIPWLFYSCLSP